MIGYRALGRPLAGGLRSKYSFVIFASKPQLFARILRAAVGAARERRGRIGDTRNIGIADQRKDGVIERSSADFNLTALRRVAIRREHQAQEFKLFFSQGGFVLLGVVLPFPAQTADNVILLEPGLFLPPPPRNQLQVAPVARSEGNKRLRAARGTRPFE